MYDRIKELCAERSITITALEEKLGFSLGTISHWRKSMPKADSLQAVADALLTTPTFLLTGQKEKATAISDSDLEELVNLYSASDPWVKEQVLSFLKAAEQAKPVQDGRE